jgi:hypothetical protein
MYLDHGTALAAGTGVELDQPWPERKRWPGDPPPVSSVLMVGGPPVI